MGKKDPVKTLRDLASEPKQIPAHLLERSRAKDAAALGLRDGSEPDINRPEPWQYERAARTKAMAELAVIARECWQTAEDHGWHEEVRVPAACAGWSESDLEHLAHLDRSILYPGLVAGQTFGDRIALITSEASEALEAFRDGHAPTEVWYEGEDGTKPCGVPSELADIVIRVFDMAEIYGIDISAALVEKMAYNRTRPYRHGGKAL